LRIWSKKVFDSRFPILATRCEKRGKKIFGLAVFGVEVAALLIDFFGQDDRIFLSHGGHRDR
jgi:hypothetical protein